MALEVDVVARAEVVGVEIAPQPQGDDGRVWNDGEGSKGKVRGG